MEIYEESNKTFPLPLILKIDDFFVFTVYLFYSNSVISNSGKLIGELCAFLHLLHVTTVCSISK